MKTLKKISALVFLLAFSFGVNAQNYDNEKLYLPGDNLNLYAVMDLFQNSETLEGFERELNDPDSKINNLDLNGDNLIDYIRVLDYVDGTTHTIVLQVAINERENQDVAVFTVYRDKYDQVQIQLIGDEYLYGKNYIIEPYYAETPNPGYTGNTRVVRHNPAVVTRTTYIEVRTWPVVRYIYTPTYVVYRSPWFWNYYPVYWNPWRPYYWDYYYGYHSHWHNHYYSHYRYSNHYYNHYYADNYYHGHRSYSNTVRTYYDNGRYKNTYSRPDLRTKGIDEGRRVYASNPGRIAGRADGDSRQGTSTGPRSGDVRRTSTPATGRTITPTTGRKSTSAAGRQSTPAVRRNSTPATGRTITPTTGRKSTSAAGRQSTPAVRRNSTPATGRTITPTTGRKSTSSAARQSTPAVSRKSTPVRSAVDTKPRRIVNSGASSTSAGRQETGRTIVQPRSNAGKPAISNTQPRRSKVSTSQREVSRPKSQSPARSSGKTSVRATENRSARTAPAVKSSQNQSIKRATRTTPPSRNSRASSPNKSNGGR